MISGDLKTYKCVKISKSNFFTITILSLYSICSESKNYPELRFLENNSLCKQIPPMTVMNLIILNSQKKILTS